MLPWTTSTKSAPSGEQPACSGSATGRSPVIVVDASVLANALADDTTDGDTARRALRAAGAVTAPDLVDVETVSVLRKRWLRRTLSDERLSTAVVHLQRMEFERVPTRRLLWRAVELRANVSAYDACYVALAESLGVELLTADGRLATATGPRCPVRILR